VRKAGCCVVIETLQGELNGATRLLVVSVDVGMSLASKRDAVVDRQAKRDVVNEEKRRNRVRRKVIDDIGARGAMFRQVYQPAGK